MMCKIKKSEILGEPLSFFDALFGRCTAFYGHFLVDGIHQHIIIMVIITLYNSKILLYLHYFLTQQFQTSTNLLIGIFGVSNH